jgi:hypothetical protein
MGFTDRATLVGPPQISVVASKELHGWCRATLYVLQVASRGKNKSGSIKFGEVMR